MIMAKVAVLPFYLAPASAPSDAYAAGYDGTGFATAAEAQEAIPGLRALGGEWDIEWIVCERATRRRAGGATLSEARRRELGTAQLKLRLPITTVRKLKAEAKRAGVGVSAYVEGLISGKVG